MWSDPVWYVKDKESGGIFGMYRSEEDAKEMRTSLNKQYQTGRYIVKEGD